MGIHAPIAKHLLALGPANIVAEAMQQLQEGGEQRADPAGHSTAPKCSPQVAALPPSTCSLRALYGASRVLQLSPLIAMEI